MMWVLLLTVLNPTMYQLHRQFNPFWASPKDNMIFAEEEKGKQFVTEVSISELSLSSSPTIWNQLTLIVNDALSLDARGGGKENLVSYSSCSLLALTDAPKAPPLRDMVAEATFPASWCPLWSEAHGIWVYLFHASLLECGVGIWGRSRVKFILCPTGIHHWWPACSRHDLCCYPFLVSLWVPSSLHSVACGNHRAHRLDRTGQKINPPATARF